MLVFVALIFNAKEVGRDIMLVASVAVEKTSFGFDRLFDYLIPESLSSVVEIGCLVSVPFGNSNKIRQAMVLNIVNEADDVEKNYKLISTVLSDGSVISKDMLGVVNFLHSVCFCTWYEAIRSVLPSGLFFKIGEYWNFKYKDSEIYSADELGLLKELTRFKSVQKINDYVEKIISCGNTSVVKSLQNKGVLFKSNSNRRKIKDKTINMVQVNNINSSDINMTSKQKKLFDFIKNSGMVSVKEACYSCGVTEVVLKNLIKANLVSLCECETYRNPYKHVEKTRSVSQIVLTDYQNKVMNGLMELLNKKIALVSLLRGVTGSGKTQIFLKLIYQTLKEDKQCIFMVPEISLTPQMIFFFQSFFGKEIAVVHSALSKGEQLDEYKRIRRGEAKLVIGTRSAVFAPCEKLGLIIMDEEGENTYKSSDMSPRYHARDVAKYRCLKSSAMLLLASATPSIETQYFAKIGKYSEFVLNKRYNDAKLPEVLVIDLKSEPSSPISGVSMRLFNELNMNLENHEQSILLLNRRGYNSSAVCVDCGWEFKCPNCSAFMTYHSLNNSFMCHYCGYIHDKITICPSCGNKHILYNGHGTQKIEKDLAKTFPNANVLRLDTDSIFNRLDLEDKIRHFEEGKYDILIGTQMVAKGLNFPNVTLVGVLSVDNMLYGADFRCHEQMFSLLTQVVGRSGRGDKEGRAIIQTYNSDNQTILQAAKQDYEAFYRDEIVERENFFCPPFCDLCIVNFSGVDNEIVVKCARKFIDECRKYATNKVPLQVLGISTPYLEKLNNRYRKRVIIKCKNGVKFRSWIRPIAIKTFSSSMFSKVRCNIDMNGEII